MAKSIVIDKDKGMKQYLRSLGNLNGVIVDVGLMNGAVNKEGANIAEYGAFNEFGTSKIPERPFMRPAFDKNKGKYSRMIEQATDPKTSRLAFARIVQELGLRAQEDIRQEIDNKTSPANKPSTIKKKGSAHPLIDTGAMRTSVTYRIKK